MPADWLTEAAWQEIAQKAVEFTPTIAMSLAIFVAFWIAGGIVRRVVIRLGKTRAIDEHLMRVLGRAAKTGLMLFGVVMALGTLGVDVGALVAGVGLTGFALGFALKDVVSNLLAGALLLIYKPFEPGQSIEVSKFSGRVESIDLRYTILRADGKKTFVPNSMMFTNAITVDQPAES